MSNKQIQTIWPEELKEYIDSHHEKDYLIIDVREPGEYEEEHIPGSRLIPLKQILQNSPNLPEDSDIFFYCLMGPRSQVAIQSYLENGA